MRPLHVKRRTLSASNWFQIVAAPNPERWYRCWHRIFLWISSFKCKKFKILLHKIESHRLFLQIFELIWNRLLLMCFKTLDDVGLCISAKFLRNYWKKIDSLDVPKHHDPLREYKETTDHQSPITLFLWLAIQCNFVGWKDLFFLLFCKILVQNVYHLRHQYDWWKIVVQVFRPSV